MSRDWQRSWEKRHRTVPVVCIACQKTSCVTLYGTPNDYRALVTHEKCTHCGVTGQLSTNKLAKARVKPDTTHQLSFNWKKP